MNISVDIKPCTMLIHSFVAFQQTCEENRSNLTTSLKCVALCCQVCSLFCTVTRFFEEDASKLPKLVSEGHSSDASPEAESASSETSSSLTGDVADFPPNLYAEWLEFFSGTLFNTVLQLFVCHAGNKRVYQHPRQPCLGNPQICRVSFFPKFYLTCYFYGIPDY